MRRGLILFVLVACTRKQPSPNDASVAVAAPAVDEARISVVDAGNASVIAEMNAMKPATSLLELRGVACKMDGQSGPHMGTVPKSHKAPLTQALHAVHSAATSLTLYYGDNAAVLAPKDMQCVGTIGSGGESLWVVPPGTDTSKPITTVVVAYHLSEGGTSGRFGVIDTGAPLFPNMAPMVAAIRKDFPEVKTPPPYAPLAGETLLSGTSLVRYLDDPNVAGLATKANHLAPSSVPIVGSLREIAGDPGAASPAFSFSLATLAIRLEGLHVPLIAAIQADFEDRTLRTDL